MPGFDVIVVGLGAMGSAATHQLAKRAVGVLGIDRHSPPHRYGSTHGGTRITRQAVGEGDVYVPLVLRSHVLWRELGSATGVALLHATGALLMSAASRKVGSHGTADFMAATIDVARRYEIEHETLGTDEIVRRFPQFRLEEEHRGYYEPGAGFVMADRAVQVQLEEAERLGAEIHRDERVVEVRSTPGGVTVRTDRAEYGADGVVLAAGPWLGQFVEPPIAELFTVYRQVMCWFDAGKDPGAFAPDRFPVFIWEFGSGAEDLVYGFPLIDGSDSGVKVGTEEYREPTDPDAVQRMVTESERVRMYDRCLRDRIPALGSSSLGSAACLYTVTPDHGFVIDRHPAHPNVVIVAACSGHGFKHSAAIGEAVAQLVTGSMPDIDLAPFSLRRLVSSG